MFQVFIFTSLKFQELKPLFKYLWVHRFEENTLKINNNLIRYSLGDLLQAKEGKTLRKTWAEMTDDNGFIACYQCCWKNDNFLSQGTLYVTKLYLFFHYNSFLFSTKKSIKLSDILHIEMDNMKETITIRIKKAKEEGINWHSRLLSFINPTEIFYSFQDLTTAYSVITRHWNFVRNVCLYSYIELSYTFPRSFSVLLIFLMYNFNLIF